jgi:hypothetical protein
MAAIAILLCIVYALQVLVALYSLLASIRTRFWPGVVAGAGATTATGVAIAAIPELEVLPNAVALGLSALATVWVTRRAHRTIAGSDRELQLLRSRDPFVATIVIAGMLLVVRLAAVAVGGAAMP